MAELTLQKDSVYSPFGLKDTKRFVNMLTWQRYGEIGTLVPSEGEKWHNLFGRQFGQYLSQLHMGIPSAQRLRI